MFRKIIFPLFILVLVGCAGSQTKDTVYQVSTIDALLNGVYEGDVTFKRNQKAWEFWYWNF